MKGDLPRPILKQHAALIHRVHRRLHRVYLSVLLLQWNRAKVRRLLSRCISRSIPRSTLRSLTASSFARSDDVPHGRCPVGSLKFVFVVYLDVWVAEPDIALVFLELISELFLLLGKQ